MKINELLTNVYSSDFNWMEELEVKHYIPIMDKKMFVMDVISACTDEVDGFVSADRFKMNIYFNMKVLGLYTNLEIANDFDIMVEQYDLLCEKGVFNNLLSLFTDEYSVMCNTLESLLDELLIQNSIDMQVVRIANKISSTIDVLFDELNNVDIRSILQDSMNVDELRNFVNRLK